MKIFVFWGGISKFKSRMRGRSFDLPRTLGGLTHAAFFFIFTTAKILAPIEGTVKAYFASFCHYFEAFCAPHLQLKGLGCPRIYSNKLALSGHQPSRPAP